MRGVPTSMCGASLLHCFSRCLAYAFIAVAAATVAGCGLLAEYAPQRVRDDVTVRVERSAGVPPGSIVFKPIPGGMLGKATDVELFRSAAGSDRFEISLDVLTSQIDAHVATTRSDAANPGELANPRDLRIARIATFFETGAPAAGCNSFRTGLRGKWPAQVTLVYVDRPGSVRGTRYTAPYIMEYDLEFPAAGLYTLDTHARGIHVLQTVAAPQVLVARVRAAGCPKEEDVRQAAR